jgi:hypothetical protein
MLALVFYADSNMTFQAEYDIISSKAARPVLAFLPIPAYTDIRRSVLFFSLHRRIVKDQSPSVPRGFSIESRPGCSQILRSLSTLWQFGMSWSATKEADNGKLTGMQVDHCGKT